MEKQIVYAWIVSGIASGFLCGFTIKATLAVLKTSGFWPRVVVCLVVYGIACFLLFLFSHLGWMGPMYTWKVWLSTIVGQTTISTLCQANYSNGAKNGADREMRNV